MICKNKPFANITKKWLKNATPNTHKVKDRKYFEYQGIKYYVDNKNVVLDYSIKEKEVAVWLENTFGGEIYMLPRINKPDGIMTADYLYKGEYWDLKNIMGSGKRIIEDAIKKKNRQANNFIFDISNSSISNIELIRQLKKIYSSRATEFVDMVIAKKDNEVICIYKRK